MVEWIDKRIGLSSIRRLLLKKTVPLHKHSIWYYLGGMTLFLFFIQVTTGVLLLFYYRSSSDEAFESVRFIMANVEFGWLVRSVHAWASSLMIFTMLVHLFSTLLLKAYQDPRELTWLSGFGLLTLVLGFGFTGYLLPWNELSYFATRVGTETVAVLPVIGSFLLRLLRGGTDVSGATLTRFYAIHTVVLPLCTIGLLAFHMFLVQRHGMSTPQSVETINDSVRSMPFFPNFFLRDVVGWLVVIAVLSALAAYLPAELGKQADPFASAPAGIKPEWYFMFMFQTLKMLPAHVGPLEGELVGVMFFGAAGALLSVIPFLDKSRTGSRSGRVVTGLGAAMILYIVVLTVVGYLVPVQ